METKTSQSREQLLNQPINRKLLLELTGKDTYGRVAGYLYDRFVKRLRSYDDPKEKPTIYPLPTKGELVQLQFELEHAGKRQQLPGKTAIALNRYLKLIKDKPEAYVINYGLLCKLGIPKSWGPDHWRRDYSGSSHSKPIIYRIQENRKITNRKLLELVEGREERIYKSPFDQKDDVIEMYLDQIGVRKCPRLPGRKNGFQYRNLPVIKNLESAFEGDKYPRPIESAKIEYKEGCESLTSQVYAVCILDDEHKSLYFGTHLDSEGRIAKGFEDIPLERIINYAITSPRKK